MASRLELHEVLCEILGSKNVYFQPPESVKMSYPCVVYNLSSMDSSFADDYPYTTAKRYSITIIDKDPDSGIPDKVKAMRMCKFDRFYASDNMNHWVFNLYY